jgi:hypothetical protein
MSFTEDELQSFNAILEQRLQVHRREMERTFDQRISDYRRDTEQRLSGMLQEILRGVSLKLTEFQVRIENIVSEKISTGQLSAGVWPNGHQQLEAFEVQAELPWEDLAGVIGQALDARLAALSEETRRLVDQMEQRLAGRWHGLYDEPASSRSHQGRAEAQQAGDSSPRELLHGLDHLERVLESLQVAMTANHALLSDRLHAHQLQPLERAHPGDRLHARTTAEHDTPSLQSPANGDLSSM